MRAKSNFTFIDKVVVFLHVFLSLSLIISSTARFVDPNTIWEFAFFGLAYPFLLMASIIFLVYWLLRRRWYWLMSVIAILCGWGVLSSNIGFRSAGTDNKLHDTAAIRMMTYNVHNFKRYGSKNDISTKHDILQIISHEQPDIIGFQEFYSRMHGRV